MNCIIRIFIILILTFTITPYSDYAETETLTFIGVNNDYPFSFYDVDGRPTGYAIDFITRYAQDQGYQLDIRLYPSEQAQDVFIEEGDLFYDGSFYKSLPAEKSLPLFVQEYYLYTTDKRSRSITPDDLHSFYEASTKFSDYRIGVKHSQSIDDYAQSLAPRSNLFDFETLSDVLDGLMNEEIDIAILPFHQTNSVLNHFEMEGINYVDQKLYFKNIGFWTRDEDLLHNLDTYILNEKKSGYITKLNNIWLSDYALKSKEDFYLRLFNIILGLAIAVILFLIYRGNTLQGKINSRTRQLKEKLDENRQLYDEIIRHEKFKNDYFINLSHELRTPLNVILGTVQLNELYLSKKNYDKFLDNADSFTKIIKSNSFRLLRVVNNLIDINRMDAEKYSLNIDLVDLVYMTEELIASIQPFADKRNIRLQLYTKLEEAIIECDPFEIERVIMNLLSNAIKFSNLDSKIEIRIYYDDTKENVSFSVSDQGIGISEENQKIIFNRFSQVDTTLNRNHEGHGIGLSLVKNIIDLHGGSIVVSSQLGKGATFTFTLPVKTVYTDIDLDGLSKPHQHHDRKQAISLEFSELQQESNSDETHNI